MQRVLYTFLLAVLSFWGYGQVGQPFIRNFQPDDYKGSGQIWAIDQSESGLMYFSGNNGIYIFDGQRWENYDFEGKKNFVIRSLALYGDTVFYGGVGVFGYLVPAAKGFEPVELTSELDSAVRHAFSDVWSLKIAGNTVLFSTDTMIFSYDIKKHKLDILSSDRTGYTFVSAVGGKFYYATYGKVYRYDPASKALDTFYLEKRRVWHFLPYNGDTLILVAPYNVFLYDFKNRQIVPSARFDSLQSAVAPQFIYSAAYLPEVKAYVFGTVKSGLYFAGTDGKLIKHIDKRKGIISQTVQYLFADKRGNLWAGTSMGVSLLNISLPFEIFDERNGLEGVPYSALVTGKNIFLGTNVDLFAYDAGEQKFVPVHTPEGGQVQQIFAIDTIVFSDGQKKIIVAANGGLFEITPDRHIVRISPVGNYNFSYSSRFPDTLYVIDDYTLYKITYKDGEFAEPRKKTEFDEFYYLRDIDGENLWLARMLGNGLAYLNVRTGKLTKVQVPFEINASGMTLDSVLIFSTEKGFYTYSYDDGTFKEAGFPPAKVFKTTDVSGFYQISKDKYLVLRAGEINTDLYLVSERDGKITVDSSIFKVVRRVEDVTSYADNLWFITPVMFVKYRMDRPFDCRPLFKPVIRQIVVQPDSVIYTNVSTKTPEFFELPFKSNSITVYYALPSYFDQNNVMFSFGLQKGNGKIKWGEWTTDTKKELSNLNEGRYVFYLKARNEFMQETPVISFGFKVLPPWYRTWWAYLGYLLLLALGVFGIVKLNERRLRRENERLEQLVKLRTAEIEQQKEEIRTQAENLREINQLLVEKNEEIQQILESLREANKQISKQHQHIRASIEYAHKIQKAIISRRELFERFFDEYFIFFKPKEIVSGDFYWSELVGNRLFVAVADCTGHGVPGAFMSMLSFALLSQIVAKMPHSTREILEELRNQIVKILVSQSQNAIIHRDGLDISFVSIDLQTGKMQYSGAYNPLIVIRDGEIIEYKAVKASIGYSRNPKPFEQTEIQLRDGDVIYMFTDGFIDQYGGQKNTKFYRKNFYRLLGEIHTLPMQEQLEIVSKVFEDWKGLHHQIDDVTVMGLRISLSKLRQKNLGTSFSNG